MQTKKFKARIICTENKMTRQEFMDKLAELVMEFHEKTTEEKRREA